MKQDRPRLATVRRLTEEQFLAWKAARPGRRRAMLVKLATTCVHLGQLTGDTVRIRSVCQCGNNTTEQVGDYRLATCQLHGLAMVDYRCAKTAISEEVLAGTYGHPCSTCRDYQGKP